MRNVKCRAALTFSTSLFLAGSAAFAGGEKLAGHHWEDAEYVSEIRLQILLMALVSGFLVVSHLLKRVLQRRSAR